jgi:hypothetical protein
MAGILWEEYENFTPFYLSLVLTIVASALLLFVKENRRSRQP